jgi:hypothetical protein
VEKEVLVSLPESEINRQTWGFIFDDFVLRLNPYFSIIHKVISKEKQYVQDLDTVENVSGGPRKGTLVVDE